MREHSSGSCHPIYEGAGFAGSHSPLFASRASALSRRATAAVRDIEFHTVVPRSLVRSRQFLPRVGPQLPRDGDAARKVDRVLESVRTQAARRVAAGGRARPRPRLQARSADARLRDEDCASAASAEDLISL